MVPSHNHPSSGWEGREPALYAKIKPREFLSKTAIYGLVRSSLNYKLSATIKMANEILQTSEEGVMRASCFQSNRGAYSLSKICIRAKMHV